MRILVAPSTFGATDRAPLERLRQSGADVVNNPFGRVLTEDELLALLPGACGVIAGLEPLTRRVLQESALKVVSRCGAGLDNVDLSAARDFGIEVRSTPDAPTTAVAELTLGALLGLLREIPRADRDLHDGRWTKRVGVQLEGRTVLVVGYGRIGRRVASLVAAFGAQVLVVDPAVERVDAPFELLSLRDALPRADIVTLHASGTGPLVGANELALMKSGVYLLNAARGGLIDERSLVEALDSGKVAGAWLDTFAREPYSGALTHYSQVVLTPHLGSYTAECRRRMEMEAVENLLGALVP